LPALERHAFDRAYIERLIAGDPQTEEHFTRYFGTLLTIKLRSRLRSPTRVDDARQETFVRVLAALKVKRGLDKAETLGAFVNAVCNNVLFETYRADARTTALDDEHDEPDGRADVESSVMAAEERAQVRDALHGLPEKDRTLIHWLFFEGRDKDEICRELHVDRQYLRVLLHRAKARFREQFMREAVG
jgi:RNA polymerase sigma-70 factor (ECF subfamily)